jgi:hypothetical protein
MSGEHFDQICYSVERVADELVQSKNLLHVAFGNHLALVATALHDIDWVLSGDCSEGDEEEAIKKVLGKQWRTITIQSALDQMDQIRNMVVDIIYKTE